MRLFIPALAVLALAAAPAAAIAPRAGAPDPIVAVQGKGKAKKPEVENHGKAVAKDKSNATTAATRANKGGETRGNARADQVKDLNQQKKPGG